MCHAEVEGKGFDNPCLQHFFLPPLHDTDSRGRYLSALHIPLNVAIMIHIYYDTHLYMLACCHGCFYSFTCHTGSLHVLVSVRLGDHYCCGRSDLWHTAAQRGEIHCRHVSGVTSTPLLHGQSSQNCYSHYRAFENREDVTYTPIL